MPNPTLGILMLDGKMADVPGCMACEATFPYPVSRKVVAGAKTPFTQADAEALLPLYIQAGKELEQEGVSVITANCGLIALLQKELAGALTVPVVTSGLLLVPTVSRLIGPQKKVGIITFFTSAVGEKNYQASGWSATEIPVVLGGVGDYDSWNQFLRTKEVDPALQAQMEADLCATASAMLAEHPEIGAFVVECTMIPAALGRLRASVTQPVYDILTALDWAMSGYARPVPAVI